VVRERDIGLQAVIAIHSTVLGPALGGMRVRDYPGGLAEALDDALRLSRAMTFKAAAAGLDLGGGKAVVVDDGRRNLRSARLVALAREVERLGGAYITAEDIGTTTADMDLISEHTRHVVGLSAHDGLGGDPSPATAVTVLGAVRAALWALDRDEQLESRAIGVIGLGKVGQALARLLLDAGAVVVGYDPVRSAADRFCAAGGELAHSAHELFTRPLDVLAPCAVGAMIDGSVARSLQCRIVCGSANNPLSGRDAEAVLARRGILYVPDFLANCGGLIHVDAERRRDPDPSRLERALAGAQARTREVLLEARATGRLPGKVAEEHAWARINRARAGHIVDVAA
jgi:glutamate dehydrogenase/leucine dehydrogenase